MDYRIIGLWRRKKLEKVQYYKNIHSQFYIEIQCGLSIKMLTGVVVFLFWNFKKVNTIFSLN